MYILPVDAPTGTAVVNVVALTTVNKEDTPLKVTVVVPVKFNPVMVTVVPRTPFIGVNDVMTGAGQKSATDVTIPAGVVTVIFPVVASAGTVAVMVVEFTTVNTAVFALNFTLVAPVKLVPVIVTTVSTAPLTGVKELIVAGMQKSFVLVAVPLTLVTVIFPVVAPAGTVVVIVVALVTVNADETPLNLSAVMPVKLIPVIVTGVLAEPKVGAKDVITGAGEKSAVLIAVPPGVVTDILPMMAPTGTVVVIEVAFTALNVADVVLNFTAVASVKLVPVIVTAVPVRPVTGVKELMVGGK